MFELFFLGGLVAFVVPLAVLGGMAYVFFWLISAVVKTAGAVVATVVAIVFCGIAFVGMVLCAIFSVPFLLFG
jgi:hypothetical protein